MTTCKRKGTLGKSGRNLLAGIGTEIMTGFTQRAMTRFLGTRFVVGIAARFPLIGRSGRLGRWTVGPEMTGQWRPAGSSFPP